MWKRSSLFKGDVATLSASHLASAVLFLLQPFCLSHIYNVFTYISNVCAAIKVHRKVRGRKTNGPVIPAYSNTMDQWSSGLSAFHLPVDFNRTSSTGWVAGR